MSGDSSEYDEGDLSDLIVDLIEALFDFSGDIATMHVSADIEWNGAWNRTPHRSTTIVGVNVGPTKAALSKVLAAQAAMAKAPPAPKSWKAQYNALNKTKAGRAALAGQGFKPAAKTIGRWQSGKQQPSKANRERLSAAIRERWDQLAADRLERFRQAERAAGDAFTRAVEDAAGGDVRFRDITDLGFE